MLKIAKANPKQKNNIVSLSSSVASKIREYSRKSLTKIQLDDFLKSILVSLQIYIKDESSNDFSLLRNLLENIPELETETDEASEIQEV